MNDKSVVCKIIVQKINDDNISSINQLAIAARAEGFNFVRRTIDEWQNGVNKFSKSGEILWGVFNNEICVAIGGVNIDPYANDPSIGRVRHLYVSQRLRRAGIAKILLKKIINRSRKYFNVLRLSAYRPGAENIPASRLYESIGFIKSEKNNQTHILNLDKIKQ